MDSMPPATAISDVPNMMAWAASATAFSPLPQTMLIVSALTVSASPPRSAACREGFCPSPAGKTHPITHSSILSTATPARRTASRTTIAPSSTALMSLSAPRNLPTGVRTALTITTSFMTNTSVSAHTALNHKINLSSFRRHAQRTVQADCVAVQHGLRADACNKLRKLFRLSQALRKQNCLCQRVLHFVRKARHHRSHEQPWSNGHNANAETRKFARSRKRHPRLGARVVAVAHAAVYASGNRRHVIGRLARHDAGGDLDRAAVAALAGADRHLQMVEQRGHPARGLGAQAGGMAVLTQIGGGHVIALLAHRFGAVVAAHAA